MDKKSVREIVVASAMYSLGSIFGPLLVFLVIGLTLDKIFKTHPLFLISSVFIAFIVTNVLLFKKIKKINQMMDVYRKEGVVKKDEKVEEPKEVFKIDEKAKTDEKINVEMENKEI